MLFLLGFRMNAFAQKPPEATGDERWAKTCLAAGDFVSALKEYQIIIKRDSLNYEYNYNLGTCYLNTNIDKSKAWFYIERASKDPKVGALVIYDLGRAYQSAYKFDEAIDAFTKYKSLINGTDVNYISADAQIEMCKRAKEMVAHPVNVTFENLGARVNTPFPDYNPYITKNENVLYFTSKRTGNNGNLMDFDGFLTADIFMVENKYGTWDKCKRLGTTINTPLVEETSGLSPDGSMLFAYCDNLDAAQQVRYSVAQSGKGFLSMQSFTTPVAASGAMPTSATVTRDKKTMIFAAKREGDKKGTDLYVAHALPNGGWTTPVSLGPIINTDYDEDFPQLACNDQRLYFSSIGHNSMGGFDIFYSDWDTINNRWGEPVNIGYPVNTPDDNTQICFTESGRYAYVSALRPEGYGNLDIYRVIFHDVRSNYTVIKGSFSGTDSLNIIDQYKKDLNVVKDSLALIIDPANIQKNKTADTTVNRIKSVIQKIDTQISKGLDINITVTKISTNKVFGHYKPNPLNGKFAIALQAGEYSIKAECAGYQPYTTEIKIADMEMPLKEMNMNFVLARP
jgi:hypothetical protein